MARTLTQINAAANDTFAILITRVNECINAVGNCVVSVSSSPTPDTVTGNGIVNGSLAIEVAYIKELYGGTIGNANSISLFSNLNSNAVISTDSFLFVGNTTSNISANSTTLKIGSNVVINTLAMNLGNSTVNVFANSTLIKIADASAIANITSTSLTFDIVVINTTSISVGSNLYCNTSTFLVGNSIVNSTLNSSALVIGETVISNNSLLFGNATVNSSLNSISLIIGTTVVNSSLLNVGNSTSNIIANSTTIKVGSNTQLSTSSLKIGNSIVNSTLNSSALVIGADLIVNSSGISSGNVAINTTSISINGVAVNTTSSITVANNRNSIGTRPTINFSGSGITVNVTDEPANNMVTVDFIANGGLSIGGSNTYIQVNDSGGLGGFAALTFNKTTNTLSVPIISLNNVVKSDTFTANLASGNNIIDSFYLTQYRSGEYLISVKDNAANAFQISKILLLHDGTNPTITEYGTIISNAAVSTFFATSNTTHIILQATSAVANGSLKASRTLIAV